MNKRRQKKSDKKMFPKGTRFAKDHRKYKLSEIDVYVPRLKGGWDPMP